LEVLIIKKKIIVFEILLTIFILIMIPLIPAIEIDTINKSYNNHYKNNQLNKIIFIKFMNRISTIKLFFGLGLISLIIIIFFSLLLIASGIPLFIFLINDLMPNLIDFFKNIIIFFIGLISLIFIILPIAFIIEIIWFFITLFENYQDII